MIQLISSEDFTHPNVLVDIKDYNACGLTHVSSHLRRIYLARLCKGSWVVCTHTNVKYQVMVLGRKLKCPWTPAFSYESWNLQNRHSLAVEEKSVVLLPDYLKKAKDGIGVTLWWFLQIKPSPLLSVPFYLPRLARETRIDSCFKTQGWYIYKS